MIRRRPDPFLTPAATTSRFLLLIVLTLGASAYTATWWVGGAGGWTEGYEACIAAAERDRGGALDVTNRFLGCYDGVGLLQAGVGAGAALLVAVVLWLGCRLHPWWLIRRRGLTPLDATYSAAAWEIDRLVAEAGLPKAPTFLVAPFNDSLGGRALGRPGHYHVRLNRRVVHQVDATTAPVLRAIVRHELAHIRNRDVGRTVAAILSGWVFMLLVAVPQLVAVAIIAPRDLGDLAWRLAVAGTLIALVRASVIRAREHYADVRASVPAVANREEPFVARAFADRPPATTRLGRWLRYVLTPFAAHPSTRVRARTVATPGRLLHAGFVEALATGVTVGLSWPYLTTLSRFLLSASVFHATLATGIVLGALTVAVLGVSLWRTTLRALVGRDRLPTGTTAGLGLAAGVLIGQTVSVQLDPSGWLAALLRHPLQGVLAAGVLVAGCLLFCRWSIGAAAAWLPVARGRTFAAVLWSGQAFGALAFGTVLSIWATIVALIAQSAHPWSVPIGAFGSLLDAIVLLSLLGAAVFPLLAAGRRPLPGRQVWLDGGEPVQLPRARLHPWLALAPPLVVVTIILVVDRFVLANGLFLPLMLWFGRGEVAGGYTQGLALAYGLIGTFVVLQLIMFAAVTIAATRRDGARLGVAHGVVASVLVGWLGGAALLAAPFATVCAGGDCDLYASGVHIGVTQLVTGVVAVALAMVVGPVIALVGWVLRMGRGDRWRWPADSVPRTPIGRRWPRRVALTLVAVVALAYAVPVGLYWFVATGPLPALDGGSTPDAVADAPDPDPPGTVTVRAACEQAASVGVLFSTVDVLETRNMELGSMSAATDSPAMRAFGRVVMDGTRRANQEITWLGQRGITDYCHHVLPTLPADPPGSPSTPTPAPKLPPIVAFGQDHGWPNGSSVNVALTGWSDDATVTVEVRVGNSAGQPVSAATLIVMGVVRGRSARLVPYPAEPPPTTVSDGPLRVRYAYPVAADAATVQVLVGDGAIGPASIVAFSGPVPTR